MYSTSTLGSVQETITYTYGDSIWKDKLTAYKEHSVSWNDWGNIETDDLGRSYTWGAGRELRSMTVSGGTLSFIYDHNGLRTGKTLGTAVTKYICHGDKLVHVTVGSTPLHIWYDAQGRPAILNYNGTVYIYITNMQGDVLGLRNTSGTEVVRYNYDPWGYLLGTTGSLATTVGKNQPLRYRGYVYDEEMGLYYLQSRYYHPEWGRFISADSVINGNLFAYCNNTPLVFIDPDGFNSVNPFPWTSTPFDFKTSTGDNGIAYWRWYDGQGRAYVDRHFTDHGKPFSHSNPHDQKYLYDSEGNRYKTEHYNYFDDDGKFINKDNNDNYHDRWPGQDEWERDKEE